MKLLTFQTLLFFIIPFTGYAQRGRVQIQDGTLVTDKGTLLRGVYISTDNTDYIPPEQEIAGIKELGLNSVHLYAECAALADSAGYKYMTVDSIVNMTERDSLYLVITIGGCGEEGTFDSAFVNAFWNFYAPRYKDKTHVIYEIMNEPFPWEAPYDTLTLQKERRAYDIIRSHAPETHILFMSYSGAINADSAVLDCQQLGDVDWNNASVATHSYYVASEEFHTFFNTLKDSGYAITVTEHGAVKAEVINMATTRVVEEEFVSYLQFLTAPEVVNNPSVYKSPIESSEVRWIPDFGTWPASLKGINYRDPYQKTEAGFFDEGLGFDFLYLASIIGYINNGDYVAYYNFDFGEGPDSLLLQYSAGNLATEAGSIEFILDSLNGTTVGLFPMPHTQNWNDYQTLCLPVDTHFEGVHKIYFIFRGSHPWDLMNVKSIQFAQNKISSLKESSYSADEIIKLYPNPARDYFTVQSTGRNNLDIYSMQGKLLQTVHLEEGENQIAVGDLKPGNYLIKVLGQDSVYTKLIIIQ